jgi:hypothetical protein
MNVVIPAKAGMTRFRWLRKFGNPPYTLLPQIDAEPYTPA